MDKAFNRGMDPQLKQIIADEKNRQENHIELIASENYVSPAVLEITGSVLTNKYAEGYPGKRYYNGCEFVDIGERLAIERMKELFACPHAEGECRKGNFHANVQPHSGSQANAAAYGAILEPGDRILGMELAAGGHLTHGYYMNFSGKIYQSHTYGVDKDTEMLDFKEIERIALECKPKLIIAGASAYAQIIDFSEFRKIADKVGAYLLVDMAHIAGLIAGGQHPNPCCYADIITTTTHKTLRGPRGGAILCANTKTNKLTKAGKEIYLPQAIDQAVFPEMQGGPLEHVIAAKAQAFYEALNPEFKDYQKQIILNIKAMVKVFKENNFVMVTNGSENHLLTVNVKKTIPGMTGKKSVDLLQSVNIVANKNNVPFDSESPFVTSGLRVGTAAMTTRGFKEKEFEEVAQLIVRTLKAGENDAVELEKVRQEGAALIKKFPIYK